MVLDDGLDKSKLDKGKKGPEVPEHSEALSVDSLDDEQRASKEMVAQLTAEAAATFDKLSLLGVDSGVDTAQMDYLKDELGAIAAEMDGLLAAYDLELQNLQKTLGDSRDLAQTMPDVFSPDDVASIEAKVSNKQREKESVQKKKEVAAKTKGEVQKHVDAKKEAETKKEKEAKKRADFAVGINKSGIDKTKIAGAIDQAAPDFVGKFVADKLATLSEGERAKITADVDKQIEAAQVKIDKLADQFVESDELSEQRQKIEGVKDKFPEKYDAAVAQLVAKRQKELTVFLDSKTPELNLQLQTLKESKAAVEAQYIKKEFASELVDAAMREESVDLSEVTKAAGEIIDPKTISLLESQFLPPEIITVIVKNADGKTMGDLEYANSPIVFTKAFAARRDELIQSVRDLFKRDQNGNPFVGIIEEHDRILANREDKSDEYSALDQEKALYQKVLDADKFMSAREGRRPSFGFDLNKDDGQTSKNGYSQLISSVRRGVNNYGGEINRNLEFAVRATSEESSRKIDQLSPFAKQGAEIIQQALEISKGPFPNLEGGYSSMSVIADEIARQAREVQGYSEQLTKQLGEIFKSKNQYQINDQELRSTVNHLSASLESIKKLVKKYDDEKKNFEDRQSRTVETKRLADANDRKARELAPDMQVAVDKAVNDVENLERSKSDAMAQVRELKDKLPAIFDRIKVLQTAKDEAAKPILGFMKRKVEVPVYSEDGQQIGTEKMDEAQIAAKLKELDDKRVQIIHEANGIIQKANKDLENSRLSIRSDVEQQVNRFKREFGGFRDPAELAKLKEEYLKIEKLKLMVMYDQC